MTKATDVKNEVTTEVTEKTISPKEMDELRKELLAEGKAKLEAKIDKDLEKKAAKLMAKREADKVNDEKKAKAKVIDDKIAELKKERQALGLKGGGGGGGTRGPRPKSVSGNYPTIKSFVAELLTNDPDMSYDDMETEVTTEFPTSAFNRSHYSWYKNAMG